MNMARIGIDIGKVIIGGSGEEDTSFFTDDYLQTPMIEGAFEAIAELSSHGHDIWIISKCGAKVEQKSKDWLLTHSFYSQASVDPEQVLFVRKRNQKAPMAEQIGLDVFIDDREDIIQSMEGIVAYPILFTSWSQTLQTIKELGLL